MTWVSDSPCSDCGTQNKIEYEGYYTGKPVVVYESGCSCGRYPKKSREWYIKKREAEAGDSL